ncbi:TPA: IS200/IS605 family accessory protein TnpB-related protein, partial [Bacillus pseudomycoides]|nr:IS200/IS605 family accessory protein TnpB-related protein [Bacillus pseudomycoides]
IKRKNGEYYLHLTYEFEVCGRELKWNEFVAGERIAGIDVNVDRYAVSIASADGNFIESRIFYCHEMEYVSSHRRDNIAGEKAKEIIDYLLEQNVGSIVMEDIKNIQSHDTDKRINRITHQFAVAKMQKALKVRALKNGFKIKFVNPAYTSVIGRFKYSKPLGISVHEAAAYVIARRGIGFEDKVPKALMKTMLRTLRFHLVKTLGSLEESKEKTKKDNVFKKQLKSYLKTLKTFKSNHYWKNWNVVHKTL